MMTNITVVTAFFDIGRSTWTSENGFPWWLARSVDTYLERFGNLAQLENEMIVYTSPDLVDRVKEYRKGKEDRTSIVSFDYHSMYDEEKKKISMIQSNQDYINSINPNHRKNPESWNFDYVMVTSLKAYFVNKSIQDNLVTNEQVAWVDFGFCRSLERIPSSKKWKYDLNNKTVLFGLKYPENDIRISNVVKSGDVYLYGGVVAGPKQNWPIISSIMKENFDMLLENNLSDDDQTLWLMSFLRNPELFDYKIIPYDEDSCFNMLLKISDDK